MSFLYLLGGRQRKLLFKNEEEQHLYEAALILCLDTSEEKATLKVEHKIPPEARASANSSSIFKSGTLAGGTLYTCTSTEVLIFEVPGFERTGYVSLPCFNDVHHVAPAHDGDLLVANTGLDMVVKFSRDGKMLTAWNVLGEIPWSRFSPEVDYRKVDSTKPHQSHPNAVFELENQIWVTRFNQRDAICLTAPGKRIEIGVQRPHDGLVWGERIYFTTVDGRIVIANRRTLAIEQIVDLNEIHQKCGQGGTLLGWCRGLLPIDERLIWVGFTRVRKTMFQENVMWIKHAFKENEKPTHISLYDLAQGKCIQEIDLERFGMNVIFGIYRPEFEG